MRLARVLWTLVALLVISILIISALFVLFNSQDRGDELEVGAGKCNINQEATEDRFSRAPRDIWTDDFEQDVLIEEMENVKIKDGSIELSEAEFFISSTSDFDNGTKNNTVTETDEYEVPSGELRIISPTFSKDPNLQMYLPMNEGSGSKIFDKTSNKNDGTISGATWSNGKFGNGLDFDGSNDIVTVPDSSSLRVTSSLTLEGWLKIDTYSRHPFGKWDASNNNRYKIGISQPGNNIHFSVGNGITTVNAFAPISFDTWIYIVGTYDGTNVKIYLNGTLKDTTPLTGNIGTSSRKFLIGGYNVNPYNLFYDGALDEIKVYDRALSASEIQANYNSGKLYNTSGTWESTPIELYNEYSLSETTVEFSDVMPGKSEIDRIEWLENGKVKATYETDIDNPAKSPLTISESDLTSGSLRNLRSNFTIKLHLVGDGTHTPVVSKLQWKLRYSHGHIISKKIMLNQNYRWDSISLSKSITPSTYINVSVLDGITGDYIDGFDNMSETFVNLSTLDSKQYPLIRIRADFNGSADFSPKLNDWSVSWKEDYPILDPEIPSNYTLPEDSNAKHLIDLGDYFYDYYDSLENLTFELTYQSNKKHLEAKVKDRSYLSFYSKKQDWSGLESFKVSCTDTGGLKIVSNKFDVTVIPVDDPPIWSKKLPNLKMDEDTKKENWLDLDDYVSDIEEDYLDFAVVNLSDQANITITINSDNKVTIIPIQDYFGTVTVTLQVFEGDNGFLYANDTFDIIVYPTNDPPLISPPIEDQTVNEDEWLNFTIVAIDKDPEETFSFYSNITKENFKLDLSSGNLSFHPSNDDVGELFINITVMDKDSVEGFEDFKITVLNVNDPPDDPVIIKPKTGSKFKINERIDFIAKVSNDTDALDTISYSWDFDVTDGIQKDRTGREVNYTYAAIGKYIITLTISDGTIQRSTTIYVNITTSTQPPGPGDTDGEGSKKGDDNNLWVLVVILIVVICMVIISFMVMRNRKKSILKEYLKEIEQAYDWARTNPAIGKEKLTNLRLRLSNDLKNGVLSKEDYSILENKLNDYMNILGMQKPIGVIPSAIPAGRPVSILPSVTPTSVSTSQPTPIARPQITPTQPKSTPQLPAHTPMPTPIPTPVPKQPIPVQPQTQPQPKPQPTPTPKPSTPTPSKKKDIVECFNCGNLVTITRASDDEPTILHCPKCGQKGMI